jgi:hypothetical protein
MHWLLPGWLQKKFWPQARPAEGPRFWESSGPPYCVTDISAEIRQAEIISDLRYYSVVENAADASKLDINATKLPYAITITPDCDLLQDFKGGKSGSLFGVLLFPMEEGAAARKLRGKNTAEWRSISGNHWSQFYFLSAIGPEYDNLGTGLPDLLVDFKRYFTVPASEITRQCKLSGTVKASRRCRLNDMWREDFRHRALAYMGRIGVPDPLDER